MEKKLEKQLWKIDFQKFKLKSPAPRRWGLGGNELSLPISVLPARFATSPQLE